MPIVRTPARAVYVDYVCDKCGVGAMKRHGKAAYLTDPMQFPHRCASCGHETVFTCEYPQVTFERETISLAING